MFLISSPSVRQASAWTFLISVLLHGTGLCWGQRSAEPVALTSQLRESEPDIWSGESWEVELEEGEQPGEAATSASEAEGEAQPPSVEAPAPAPAVAQPPSLPRESKTASSLSESVAPQEAPPVRPQQDHNSTQASASPATSAPSLLERPAGSAPAPASSGPSSAGSGAAATQGGMGGTASRARDLPQAFTRAIPVAASRDPIWQNLPLGSQGKVRFLFELEPETGRIAEVQLLPVGTEQVPPGWQGLKNRVVGLLRGGQFRLPEKKRCTQQELEIEIRLEQREATAEEEGHLVAQLGFEPPQAQQAGKAYFTLRSGRYFEARVQVKE